MNYNSVGLVVIDPVASQGGVATGHDLDPAIAVGGNVIILQRPKSVLMDVDAILRIVVDLVAAQGRVAASPDLNA